MKIKDLLEDETGSGDSLGLGSLFTGALRGAERTQQAASGDVQTHGSTGSVGGSDSLDDIEFAQGQSQGRVRMQNSGATRNKPLNQRLMNILVAAAEEAQVDVVVFSGGQDARGQGTRRTGSVRHDNGNAADVWIYSGGRRLSTAREDPIVSNFIRAAVAAGAKGIGAGPGYMDSVGIHVDIVGDAAGGSVTWGRGSRSATTPGYVTAAYTAGQSGTGTA